MRIEWLSDEALESSTIEGEILDQASVRSSIRRHFGLEPGRRVASPAEVGVAEMMVALYRVEKWTPTIGQGDQCTLPPLARLLHAALGHEPLPAYTSSGVRRPRP